jgi:Mn2+/Fe2+ NRAMP family transporter
MGDKVNSFWLNALSWVTVIAIFAATIGLVASWVL